MTPSEGINFRVSGGGLRRLLARAACERASLLFEFAVSGLVLSVLLIGIVYGGITFYDYETLANAAAAGARTAAINAYTSNGQPNTQACYDGQQALLQNVPGLNSSLITVTFPITTTTGTYTAGTLSCTVSMGNSFAIKATYPCSMYFPTLGINLCNGSGSPPTISAQAAIRIE